MKKAWIFYSSDKYHSVNVEFFQNSVHLLIIFCTYSADSKILNFQFVISNDKRSIMTSPVSILKIYTNICIYWIKKSNSFFQIPNATVTELNEDDTIEYLPRDKHFATRALHSGYTPSDTEFLSVVPPIYLSTTYEQLGPGVSKVSLSKFSMIFLQINYMYFKFHHVYTFFILG